MIFEPKIMGNKKMKVYCATCKKEIKCKDKLAFSSTKSGVLKIHHSECKK